MTALLESGAAQSRFQFAKCSEPGVLSRWPSRAAAFDLSLLPTPSRIPHTHAHCGGPASQRKGCFGYNDHGLGEDYLAWLPEIGLEMSTCQRRAPRPQVDRQSRTR